jgi:hypothetical protein
MKLEWICPVCGGTISGKTKVLTHLNEAHPAVLTKFPNALVPIQNLLWSED